MAAKEGKRYGGSGKNGGHQHTIERAQSEITQEFLEEHVNEGGLKEKGEKPQGLE